MEIVRLMTTNVADRARAITIAMIVIVLFLARPDITRAQDATTAKAESAETAADAAARNAAQNPVAPAISLPFQNNTNLNFGPGKGTQNILNIQPVIPISISDEWNIITRTIVPLIHMPSLGLGIDSKDGVGDTVFTAFLSPRKFS